MYHISCRPANNIVVEGLGCHPQKRLRAAAYASSMTPVMRGSPLLWYATVERIAMIYATRSLEYQYVSGTAGRVAVAGMAAACFCAKWARTPAESLHVMISLPAYDHGCHPGTVTCVASLEKNSFSPFDTQVPSQRTLVLNIVNSFKTDD